MDVPTEDLVVGDVVLLAPGEFTTKGRLLQWVSSGYRGVHLPTTLNPKRNSLGIHCDTAVIALFGIPVNPVNPKVVLARIGDTIPADMRVVEANGGPAPAQLPSSLKYTAQVGSAHVLEVVQVVDPTWMIIGRRGDSEYW